MSSSTTKAIFLLGKALGVDFEEFERDFNQRLIFQKLLFLLFKTSSLNYLRPNYGLYIHGPYSPELTQIGYEISKTQESDELKSAKLSEKGERLIEKSLETLPSFVKQIVDNSKNNNKFEDIEMRKLEYFATLVMLCEKYNDIDDSDIRRELIEERIKELKGENVLFDELYNDALKVSDSK